MKANVCFEHVSLISSYNEKCLKQNYRENLSIVEASHASLAYN